MSIDSTGSSLAQPPNGEPDRLRALRKAVFNHKGGHWSKLKSRREDPKLLWYALPSDRSQEPA
jgi:hypothetical protein